MTPTRSNTAFVTGSSGLPMSALIFECVLSFAPNMVTGTPAAFSTLPNRTACAVVSGWPDTCRIRNGGMPFPFATCVTAEKSLCLAGSLPNFSRCPNLAGGSSCAFQRASAVAMMAGTSKVSPSTGTHPFSMSNPNFSAFR